MTDKKTAEQRMIDDFIAENPEEHKKILEEAARELEDVQDLIDSISSEKTIKFNRVHDKKYTTEELLKELGIEE